MKKKVIAMICAVACLVSCFVLPVSASAAIKLTLSSTSLSINSGNSKTITIKIGKKVQNSANYYWYTSNSSVATVTNGRITAKRRGTATITTAYKKNKTIRASCTVKVDANFTVSPTSNPNHNKYTNYSTTYNKYTKQYYMLRSYLEQINSAGGGTLTLKKGTYSIPCTLYVPNNITIKLLDGVILKKSNATHASKIQPSQSMFQLVRPNETTVKHKGYNGAHDIKILGYGKVYIDMYNSIAGKSSAAFVMGHNKNVTFSNIYFKNLKYGHFIEMDASKNVLVKNCSFCNTDAIAKTIASGASKTGGGSVNLDIPDKKTGGFTQPWTSYDCTPNEDITFDGCRFNNVQFGVETHQYTPNKYHKNVTIKNTTFGYVTRFAVQMMNWQSPTLTNNKFNNIGIGIAKPKDNITMAVYMAGVSKPTISGNTFNTCSFIMKCYAAEESKYGYAPIDNHISEAEYQAIADSNYSVNNSYDKRELVVYSLVNGKISYKHLYPDIHFATK